MINPNELFDVVDENNEPTGEQLSREEVHNRGLWHRAIHVWIYCDDQILLQKRTYGKGEDDGKWDISVAGHLAAGDEPRQAAIREVKEELGLDIDDAKMENAGQLKAEWDVQGMELPHRQFLHIFFYKLDEPAEISFDDGEVIGTKWMSLEDYRWAVGAPETHLQYKQHNKEYRQYVDKAFEARS